MADTINITPSHLGSTRFVHPTHQHLFHCDSSQFIVICIKYSRIKCLINRKLAREFKIHRIRLICVQSAHIGIRNNCWSILDNSIPNDLNFRLLCRVYTINIYLHIIFCIPNAWKALDANRHRIMCEQTKRTSRQRKSMNKKKSWEQRKRHMHTIQHRPHNTPCHTKGIFK